MSYYKIRPRSGTASQWSTANPVLKEREIGFEVPDGGVGTGNVKMKMGDGVTTWNELPYAVPIYLSADDIVQNATTDSETKIPSAKVVKNLQEQITKNANNINTLNTFQNNISEDYQPKIITEAVTLTTNSNWATVEKSGYKLIEAVSVRNDSSYYIKGINRHNNCYILIFDGITSNTDVVVWLTWAKQK